MQIKVKFDIKSSTTLMSNENRNETKKKLLTRNLIGESLTNIYVVGRRADVTCVRRGLVKCCDCINLKHRFPTL